MAGYPVYNSFRANTKEGSGYDPYEDMQEVYNPTLPTVIGDPTATGDGRYYGDGTPGSSNSNSGSSYNLPSFDDIVGSLTKQFGQGLTNPQLIPGLASAYQYYQNADKYGDMGSQLSKDANPFGDRSQYVQGLSNLYKDPSSIENSAAYQFRLMQGLNTLGPKLAAKGGGYGNAAGDMMDYAQGLASTEYDKEWQRLYEAAGGKFDPANAGKLQLDAARLESDAKNAALGQMMAPFAPQPTTTINNNSSTNGGGSGNNGGGSGYNNGATGKYQFPPAGQLGATGTWAANGMYKLFDGTLIDVTKLSDAARNGDQTAIEWLTKISGGATVDEQIRNLGVNWNGGDTGDPYNPGVIEQPYNPDEGMYPTLPDQDYSGGALQDQLESWWGYEGME
jgi:hypothetical protein